MTNLGTVTFRGQAYSIDSVSDILINIGAMAIEQGLTKLSAISQFAYFLKSCCPSISEEFCKILGFTPTGEPVFTLALDSDEIITSYTTITIAFLKGRIARLETLKGNSHETDKKIADKILTFKDAIETASSGVSKITINALVETVAVETTNPQQPQITEATAIKDSASILQQIKMLEEQLKATEAGVITVK